MCDFPISLKEGVRRVLPWMWDCFQRLPPALFRRVHRIEGGGMTLLLRHSSGAPALGAEFPTLGLASSVVCSTLLRGCLCRTKELSTESPGADSGRSAWPCSGVGHCVEAPRTSLRNTAALIQALPGDAGAVLLPVLQLSWLWLIWASLYHAPLLNPGSTEVLRN